MPRRPGIIFEDFLVQIIAAGCFLAATKAEDYFIRLKFITGAYLHVRHGIKNAVEKSEEFVTARVDIERAERYVLHVTEFDLHIEHPMPFVEKLIHELHGKLGNLPPGNEGLQHSRHFVQARRT